MPNDTTPAPIGADALREALELCSAELFAQCADQPRAMQYVEQARAALASAAQREYAASWLQAYNQMGRKKMKAFVWEDVLTDYTSGMMVAVAPTVEEARAALLKECYYIPEGDLNQQPKELDLSEAVGFVCWGGG